MGEMPRCRAVLSGVRVSAGGDWTGWLAREDSNLRMAESKAELASVLSESGPSHRPVAFNLSYAAALMRSRKPVTPTTSAQCSQQKKVPSFSSP
jgi:hypothetical protein